MDRATEDISCPVCQKQFSRQEHLKRHSLIHVTSKRFQCNRCSKSFLRKDALTRHMGIHTQPESVMRGKGRACLSCAAAKARCSGQVPCHRCSTKSIECAYPPSAKEPVDLQTSYSEPKDDRNPLSQTTFTGAISDELSSMAVGSPNTSLLHLTEQPSIQDVSQTSFLHGQPDLHSPVLYAENRNPNASFTNGGNFTPYDSGFPNDLPFDQPYWNSGILSDINWLPINDEFAYEQLISPIANSGYDYYLDPDVSPRFQYAYAPTSTEPAPTSEGTGTRDAVQSPNTTVSRESGEYYVDGDAARLPHVKRRKVMTRPTPSSQTHNYTPFSLSTSYHAPNANHPWITTEQYDKMKMVYQKLCLDPSPYFTAFEQQEFPSQGSMSSLVNFYFDNFDQALPFLPNDAQVVQKRDWRLLLCLATLGSPFVKAGNSHNFASSMSEFLRRVIIYSEQSETEPVLDEVSSAQVQLLATISMLYGSEQKNRDIGLSNLSRVSRFCRPLLIGTVTQADRNHHSDLQEEITWEKWRDDEERRRTGFCIWLLDCMCAFQFQQPPFLKLEDAANVVLPCLDEIWQLGESQWADSKSRLSPPPTLLDAVQNLYIEKRLLPNLGEFSRILLIHSLFHRTWEVEHYIQQGLSRFEPIAEKRSSADLQPALPIWPPAIPLFNRWRNSACDCLDILHWSANGMIGAASGMEHPTVLHLHLARVVLLAPMDSIVRYSKYLSKAAKSSAKDNVVTKEQVRRDKGLIQRWAAQDQYKSRLAAIHAGVILWHVRKYSINAFYEPAAVALATLMFWALTTFQLKKSERIKAHQQVTNEDVNNSNPLTEVDTARHDEDEDLSESEICDIILIDRPTDDELVQQFVKHGRRMRANMTGVGDLWAPKGGQKVLLEGCKLVASLDEWNHISTYWLKILENLRLVIVRRENSTR